MTCQSPSRNKTRLSTARSPLRAGFMATRVTLFRRCSAAAVMSLQLVFVVPIACAQRGRAPESSRVITVLEPGDSAAHLFTGFHSRVRDSLRLVIDDSASFVQLATRIGVEAFPHIPAINFRTRQVIVAALGQQSSPGPSIRIDSVVDQGDDRIVIVRRTYMPPYCNEAQMYTQPTDVIVARRSARNVHFVERRTDLRTCPR
jgi:hypothetical protein